MTILSVVLFGTAFLASVWTLFTSIRPQLHRYRALFAPTPSGIDLPLRATRVMARRVPAQQSVRMPLRAAA